MDVVLNALGELRDAAGISWLAAVVVVFATMICESAGPVAEPGAEKPKPGALRTVSLIVSLLTPILLFVHAYWAIALMDYAGPPDGLLAFVLLAFRSATLVGLYVVMLVLILLPSAFGALIRKVSRPTASALYAAAPLLTLAAFGFAVFVTQRNFAAAVDLILGRL